MPRSVVEKNRSGREAIVLEQFRTKGNRAPLVLPDPLAIFELEGGKIKSLEIR